MADFSILNNTLRSNLLAVRKTQKLIDETTLRLASGLKVNSAIDDPQNFFSARALEFRANDLRRRLDGIGQSIRVLQETQIGIDASLNILDLAESYLEDIVTRYQAGDISLTPSGTATNVTDFRPSSTDFVSYAGAQDSGAPVLVTNGGSDFTLDGNLWKRALINYTVTSDTVLEFEYASTATPEIASIGFETDNAFPNDNNRFFLHGTQFGGISYAAPIPTFQYSGSGAYETYQIPIGAFFTGTFSHITFINDDDSGPLGNSSYRNLSLREGPVNNALVEPPGLQEGYGLILQQLDELVEDASYRGINLLKNGTLQTLFNETGTNQLVTEGIDATSSGLGLSADGFSSIDIVEAKIEQVRTAREALRSYSGTIASDLDIIKTREVFTRETINTLIAGRDDLTLADQNEEGANLLALQTRQSLGVTSLSLASQSQRSILTIFS